MLGSGCFPQFPDDGFCVTNDDDGVKEVDSFEKVSPPSYDAFDALGTFVKQLSSVATNLVANDQICSGKLRKLRCFLDSSVSKASLNWSL